jgi:AmmeMemoRadiSam system protein B/AmmeMemoRadiSam system protein A
MKRMHWLVLVVGTAFTAAVAGGANTVSEKTVREPAVAGLFYPRDAAALERVIDQFLASATKTEATGELKALICPHAGYPYSGPVAASGFRLLSGRHYATVFVLGPSHYALLNQAAVSGADRFRTPLGDVPISAQARLLGRVSPFALDPRCDVQRPSWTEQSSRPVPVASAEGADTWEHADEVEVPFLQRTLSKFELVPVVMGDVDAAQAARALGPFLDDTSLLVVSSDLSHYHPYAEARRLDRECVDAICALDLAKMSHQEACGRIPILTLMHLARQRGWRPTLLDLRNSGDTAGDTARVVGYAAIAFFAPAAPADSPRSTPAPTDATLTAADQGWLLALARDSLRQAATAGRVQPPPGNNVSEALAVPRGVFVTLTKNGALRGCIGHIVPQMPLYRAVAENTRNAALSDPRFPPVTPAEVDRLEIEISVLTPPRPLTFTSPDDLLRKLRPHKDGVVLTIAAGLATYLPQVWEMLPDKVEFLDSLAEKAGGQAGDWRKPGAKVAIYHVVSFKEAAR